MFIEALLIGLIFGKLRSGKISELENINIKGLYYILLVIVLDFILRIFIKRLGPPVSTALFYIYPFISILIYVFTIMMLDINKNLKYIRLVESGFVLNLLPMVLNGGKMPVSGDAILKLGKVNEYALLKGDFLLGHKLLTDGTRFKILSDIIPVPFIIPKVISIGDIIIALGIILFIGHYMSRGRRT